VGDRQPLLVPVIPEEAGRRNAIPMQFAVRLADALGLEIEADIVRVDTARRTELSGDARLMCRAEFEGPVRVGRAIVIVDDVVTQGGTVADLRGFLEAGGAEAIAVTALQAPGANRRLRVSVDIVEALRAKSGDLEA
jgi:predicted amidophosphoribosyltransferase